MREEISKPEERQRRLTVRLPLPLHEQVKAAAARDRRPLAVMIRLMIEDCMEQRQQTAA
jgi:hypothetical protein